MIPLFFYFKIFLTVGGTRRKKFLVGGPAGWWRLAGKNSFDRWRCWPYSGAGLLDRGCGCFQSFYLGILLREKGVGHGCPRQNFTTRKRFQW